MIRAAHPGPPRTYTVEQDRALERLRLGPVPLRWVWSFSELNSLRALTVRGLAEFHRPSMSYRLVQPKGVPCPIT